MRLLETPPRYPPFTGGVENVVQALAQRLVARGDEVLVVCADEPAGSPTADGQVEVRRLPFRLKLANTNLTPGLPGALWRERWDLVETHLPTPWSAECSVLVARLKGRASVVFFHNRIVGEGPAGLVARCYEATAQRLTLRLADRVTVISDRWRDYLVSLQPSIADKIVVIPNGVDLERFSARAATEGRGVLFVGVLDRFHRYKGLDVLLEALAGVRGGFELVVVGDGELRGEYEALAARLGIADAVRFAGRVDDEGLLRAYAEAAIYVLPSDFADQEGGFTLTALEAMASGLPVVLAEGAGQLAADAERHGAGLRVRAGDVPGLSAALQRLLDDGGERKSMGVAARAYVETHHSWDEIVQRRRQTVYEEAIARAGGRRRR